ncbi:MAG: RCKP-type rubredoxin-like domain-containing protein [Nitrospirota bacterium]
MTRFKCERCGAIQEGKCKPRKCRKCGESNTMKKEETCGCGCKR